MKEFFKELEWEGRPLVLVIMLYEADLTAELVISRNHFSFKREYSFKSFNSIKEAKTYCQETYQVRENEWGNTPFFEKKFAFDYSVSNWGTPQPNVEGFEDAVIKIEVTPATEEADDLIAQKNKVDITGNAAGLRKLAAQLLLCADSEEYDEYFHIHLNNEKSNLELTLMAPNYFKANKDKQGELILFCDKDGYEGTNFT